MEKIIYGLTCPVTNKLHYVGKSTQGLLRPIEHMTRSHSEKIREWVDELRILGNKPIIVILEKVGECDDINAREKYWIMKSLSEGAVLLNENLVTPMAISPCLMERVDGAYNEIDKISKFVKERRKLVKLNQTEFAERAGVALTVIRKIEQGNFNIAFNSLLKVLSMFGSTVSIKKIINNL